MLKQDVLIKYPAFNGLDAQKLARVAKSMTYGTAKKGTIIFKRGKILTDKFFLVEGQVDLINNEFGVEKVACDSQRALESLNQESPTKVSAIAKTPVKYFSIPHSVFDLLSQEESAEYEDERPPVADVDGPDFEVTGIEEGHDWMACLLKSPIFSRIPLSQLQDLFKKFESVKVEDGEVLVKEGAKGDYFYVIASGSALVTNRLGSFHVELRTGQYFGEEALVSSAPRNATVTMTSKGVIKRLCAEDFTALIKEPVLNYLDSEDLESMRRPYKIIDVKMPIEFRVQHVPGAVNVPLSRLRKSLPELAHNSIYVVADDAGSRADIAAYLLCQAGFDARILRNSENLIEMQQSA